MSKRNVYGQPVGEPLPNWQPALLPTREPMDGRYARLEPLAAAHAEALHAANTQDDGRMWTYMAYGPFATLDAYRAWVDEVSAGSDPLFFTIIDKVRGLPVGVASHMRVDARNGTLEVGHLAYSPLLQKTPAATEAMFLMMQRAFALGYRRYEWKCDALNAPSRSAALRYGFSYEGIFRQAVVYKQRTRDTAWFSMTDAEWPAIEGAFKRWLAPENFGADGQQRARLATRIAASRADAPPAPV